MKINGLYGYRTSRSMKTQESWDLAQKVSGAKATLVGWGSMLLGLVLYPFNISEKTGALITVINITLMAVYLIYATEKELKDSGY